jgi:pimeloyl-ACP methyl ester carboxylesterase
VRRPLPAALLLAALVTVSSCTGGKATQAGSSPSAAPTTAAPTATPATTPPGSTTAKPTAANPAFGKLSAWKSCSGGFQCATLTVNLDDAKPSLGTVGLAMTRHKATGSRRIGSLVVNPGGPGASAVDFAQNAYTSLPSSVRERFDVVAFDPRGVGHTEAVSCGSTAELDAYFHLNPVPVTPAEKAQLTAGNKKFDAGCLRRSKRILPYVSTRIVAQDLERVRQAVGDAKLTYLGYSYGTALGASYLDQFPTHVRAMVLDGALDPTLSWDQLLGGQSRGFDVALKAFLADCQQTSCAFRKATSGDLGQAYDALYAKVHNNDLPGRGSRTVGEDEFTLGVGEGLYSKRYGWPAIADALASAQKGDGGPMLTLSDDYLERANGQYASISQSINAVSCIDRPWPTTEAPYYAAAAKVGRDYPRFGPAIMLSGLLCATWPVAPVSTPHPVSGKGSPPILVIGTTGDPATPYSWAQALAKQLTSGILLTHVGEGHTVYRIGAPSCITNPVNSYLIALTAPRPATC